jgi:hypothetical protein
LSAASTALAVLALGVRIPLQPIAVSYLFLGLTLLLLERAARSRGAGGYSSGWLRAYGPLLVLFALWVNLDGWFFLGPLTVGLYLVGTSLGERRAGVDVAGLALLLPAGLAACLLNPWHVRAFILPPEFGLSASAAAFRNDPTMATLSLSPFQSGYWTPGVGLNPAGLAFFLLALLGLGSFFLNPEGRRGWRGAVWLGYFLLAAWMARAVPFFAVVAGPILARNLQDFAARRRSAIETGPDWALAGRGLTLAALVLLVVAAWPGWLQGTPHERRQWAAVPDPSVQRAADQVARWRQDGLLPAEVRSVPFSLDAANYLAWFHPEQKSWVDGSLQAPPQAAADYVAFRRALLRPDAEEKSAHWRKALHDQRIDLLVLYDVHPDLLLAVFGGLMRSPVEWELLLVEGSTAVFGWHDPGRVGEGDRFAGVRMNLDRQAFSPPPDKKAPAAWAGRTAQPAEWWDALLTPRPPRADDRDEAAMRLRHFDAQYTPYRLANLSAWLFQLSGSCAGAGTPATLPSALWQALEVRSVHVAVAGPEVDQTREPLPLDRAALEMIGRQLRQGDDGAPALLLLAIRAARRALHVNPDDAPAYLTLGEAYLDLLSRTRERVWGGSLRRLRRLREVQAAGALHQAVLLDPDLLPAHMGLFNLYDAMGYKDLALEHLRELLRLTRARGRMPGETPEQSALRLTRLTEHVRLLSQEVQQQLDLYLVSSQNRSLYTRAVLALEKGLAAKALEVLLGQPDFDGDAGAQAIRLALELLLASGRLREARDGMDPKHEQMLGRDEYFWLQAQLEAACGNYAEADLALASGSPLNEMPVADPGGADSLRAGIALTIGQAILDSRLDNSTPGRAVLAPFRQQEFLRALFGMTGLLAQRANTAVLRAVLDVEAGEVREADELLRRALAVWQGEAAAASGAGLDFDGRPAAQRLLEQLSAVR